MGRLDELAETVTEANISKLQKLFALIQNTGLMFVLFIGLVWFLFSWGSPKIDRLIELAIDYPREEVKEQVIAINTNVSTTTQAVAILSDAVEQNTKMLETITKQFEVHLHNFERLESHIRTIVDNEQTNIKVPEAHKGDNVKHLGYLIDNELQTIASLISANRVGLIELHNGSFSSTYFPNFSLRYEIINNVRPLKSGLQNKSVDDIQDWIKLLNNSSIVNIKTVEELPPLFQHINKSYKFKEILLYPIKNISQTHLIGILYIDWKDYNPLGKSIVINSIKNSVLILSGFLTAIKEG